MLAEENSAVSVHARAHHIWWHPPASSALDLDPSVISVPHLHAAPGSEGGECSQVQTSGFHDHAAAGRAPPVTVQGAFRGAHPDRQCSVRTQQQAFINTVVEHRKALDWSSNEQIVDQHGGTICIRCQSAPGSPAGQKCLPVEEAHR
jgi:hypothetical protein